MDNGCSLADVDSQANATSGLGLEKEEGASAYQPLLGHGSLVTRSSQRLTSGWISFPLKWIFVGAEIELAQQERHLHRFREA